MAKDYRQKRWDDVTVSCWIPARLVTKLDLFALRLKADRASALESLLRLFLEEDGQKAELGKSRPRLLR